jgi:hypothetical protein
VVELPARKRRRLFLLQEKLEPQLISVGRRQALIQQVVEPDEKPSGVWVDRGSKYRSGYSPDHCADEKRGYDRAL